MSASVVEIVFVIDASDSMRPCFEGLSRHMEQFLQPLQGFNFQIRLGMVALKVGKSSQGGRVVDMQTLVGSFSSIYGGENSDRLFTNKPEDFIGSLQGVQLSGDENSLLALDIALDFPFGPVNKTRRVVALFSDEPIEGGAVVESEFALIPELIKKITDRRILLFVAMPNSPSLELLGATDGCQIQSVQGGDGLGSVDFSKLMGQMAKSISVASLQGNERPYRRALFDQDKWGASEGSFSFEGMR